GGAGGDCGYDYHADVGSRGGDGIVFSASGRLLNSGIVTGGHGGAGGTGPNFAVAAGGTGGSGIYLERGTLTNSGTITGGAGGVGAAGYVDGATGATGDGVDLSGGGSVRNLAGGVISGGVGIAVIGSAATTVVNYGAILGATHAVTFASAADELIALAGSSFVGAITGGGGTLELANGAGVVSGLGGAGQASGAVVATFAGFGSYIIGGGGHWTLTGANTLASGQSLTSLGALTITGAVTETAGATISAGPTGSIVFNGATDVLAGTIGGAGAVAFFGGVDIFDGTRFSATGMVVNGAAVTLEHSISLAGELRISGPNIRIGPATSLTGGGTLALSNLATNAILAAAGDTLTNLADTISGSGLVGGGGMILINRVGGTIDGSGTHALILDTGAKAIANVGLIEATGGGGVVIQSAVYGGGRLEAAGGTLTVNGAVSGSQRGVIGGGALAFNSTFAGAVAFTGSSGVLELARSQSYTGSITGFSKTGGTLLDLRDIAFKSASEATFSGTASSGILTVTDGAHTARITLIGDYLGSTFTASSDGDGGTIVVDPTQAGAGAPPHAFVAAAAGLRAPAGGTSHAPPTFDHAAATLFAPRVQIA
ncbi:MAG: hypothetical protein ABI056_09270, partial [Caulobacteraceae bacterium]